jgi:hypothetical protein
MKYHPYLEKERIDNKTLYRYWKDKCGLVNGAYARKVLGVGEKKFRKIRKEYDLQIEEQPSPSSNWKTKLYKLKDIYELKEKLENESQKK